MSVAGGSVARLFVLFRLGPHRFALPAENVLEICEAPGQDAPSGSFAHRGRDLPLVDLRERFLVKSPGTPRAVLVAQQPGPPDPLALLVDGVDAVITLGGESLLELPDPLHPFLGAYLQGLCVLPGEAGADASDLIALLGPGALELDDASRPAGDLP